jgi:EAL domain-containing protein (putative c-di-GMP-specific phosphodiesterase class I)
MMGPWEQQVTATIAMTDQSENSQLRDAASQTRQLFIKHLKEDNFVLFFQPIVPAAVNSPDPSLREILVRYREEEEDLLPPGSFLPLLQEEGLLPILDRWVVGRLLTWGRTVQQGGVKMPHCSINLSIDTIRRDDQFGEYVLRGIQKMGVSAAAITFEIMTVDALAHRQAIAKFIQPLRAAGITFALSWFAGEEAAFDLAHSLGASYMKLDGSFAAMVGKYPQEKAKLAVILQRCRKLGLRTICMQVEDAESLAHLRMLQVDYVQGFGIEKPRALEGF